MSLKLIFMGTPEFAVPILETLINSQHNVLTVYTQNPKKSNRGQKINISPVEEFSKKNKLIVRNPKKLDFEELNFIKKLNPDVVVVAAYGKIIPREFLNIKSINFINVHASLLPRWRGAAPIQRSIIEMDKETGISIMKIVPKLDTGPCLLQEKVTIEKKDNLNLLSKKLAELGSKLILKTLLLIEENKHVFKDQDESKATYAKKIDKKDSEIKWNMPAKNLIAIIYGLNPFPGVWFKHKNNRIKIFEAIEVDQAGKTGEVLDKKLTVACGDKAIRILSLQKEGKKILKTEDFLAGYKITEGEILI